MKINVYSEKSGNFASDSKMKPMIIIESKKKTLESLKAQYPDAMIIDVTSHAQDEFVKFTYSFDDGETLHESSNEEVFPVYLHDGQWWIGEGFSKSEREMARRGMKFLEKIGSQKGF